MSSTRARDCDLCLICHFGMYFHRLARTKVHRSQWCHLPPEAALLAHLLLTRLFRESLACLVPGRDLFASILLFVACESVAPLATKVFNSLVTREERLADVAVDSIAGPLREHNCFVLIEDN